MNFKTKPLATALGVEVSGLDLRRADARTMAKLYRLFVENSVICFRDQDLEAQEFLDIAGSFGEPIVQIYGQFNLPNFPQIGVLTSEDGDAAGKGERKIRGTSWHTDASYFERPPKATMLHALVVPPDGGDTDFLSMAAAYEALPEETRLRLDPLVAIHNYESSRSPRKLIKRSADQIERFPENMGHPLIRTNPDTARKSIYLNPIRVECIDGMQRGESDALLDEVIAHCLQPEFQYSHKWSAGDIVVWDNRSVLHQANDDYDWQRHKRRLIRIMLEGDRPH
ncbi:MAG: taurine dioxygenase [Gammaproteobacteria bacterium]|jgi:taurine dioxygenase